MPRYEKQTAKGIDYVELAIDGTTVRTVTGRVGGKPKVAQSKYPSEFAAASRFRRAIPTAKGFIHVSELRATRENLELEHAITKHPDDLAVREVYGDWLLEHGDPRGELISIQRELATATGKRAAALRKQERALLVEHSSLLFGRLDEILDVPAYQGHEPLVRVAWNLGFFDAIDLRLPVTIRLGPPFKRVQVPTLAEAIQVIANQPSGRFLRRLSSWGEADDGVLRAMSALPKSLRSLRIWFDWMQRVPDLSKLCHAHRDLEHLVLRLYKQPLKGLALPNLRELDLRSTLTPQHLTAIARGSWPRLQTLAIQANGYQSTAKPPHFDALLTATRLPALTTLRLDGMSESYATELAVLAARLPTLTTIELDTAHPPVVTAFERTLGSRIVVTKTKGTEAWAFVDSAHARP